MMSKGVSSIGAAGQQCQQAWWGKRTDGMIVARNKRSNSKSENRRHTLTVPSKCDSASVPATALQRDGRTQTTHDDATKTTKAGMSLGQTAAFLRTELAESIATRWYRQQAAMITARPPCRSPH